MPVPIGDYFGKNIVEAVKNGTVNQSRVDVSRFDFHLTTSSSVSRAESSPRLRISPLEFFQPGISPVKIKDFPRSTSTLSTSKTRYTTSTSTVIMSSCRRKQRLETDISPLLFVPSSPITSSLVQHDHWKIIREIGAASHVLLKNLNETLPLRRPRSLILIGSDAGPPPLGPNYYHDRFITPSDRTGVLAMGW